MARKRSVHGLVAQEWAVPRGHGQTSSEETTFFSSRRGHLALIRQRTCETMFLEDVLLAHG